ncbi:ribonuclease P protein component [Helicobacter himalayensis]|uniref:ribonuclease P protein component n=1 Tax=Helicobacter himalayensis TaxID=1591088 RepID=UPI001E2F6FBB|nr:ribonuclease P protein component [Helicobacter himalayensis]
MQALKIDSLKNTREFNLVYKNARRFSTPYFLLYLCNIDTLTQKLKTPNKKSLWQLNAILSRGAQAYLGLSVARKVGNAPKRNRYKRQMRAIFRDEAFRDYIAVFVPKAEMAQLEFSEFRALCLKALN